MATVFPMFSPNTYFTLFGINWNTIKEQRNNTNKFFHE